MLADLLCHRLLFVTGKGGTGKTTVAAALALAAARSGRRALVCELAGQQRLPDAFGRLPAAGGAAVELAPGVAQLSIDPADALREWLRRQPGGTAVAALLMSSTAFQQFVAAGPGVTELIVAGKLSDLAASGDHDLVVVDAPATGHVLGLLTAPRTFAAIARVGRIRRDAEAIWQLLRDDRRTAYVGVALPEEMPVRELLEFDAKLVAETGRGLDAAVMNEVWPDRYSADDVDVLLRARSRSDDPRSVGCLDAALAGHRRASAQRHRIDELRAGLPVPVTELPEVFIPRLTADDYARLADALVPVEAAGSRVAVA